MTPGDTARVLAKAAAFDQRTIGAADAAAWHEVIGDLDYADALAAVGRHYTASVDRLKPAHIRQLVRELRDERDRQQRSEVLALPGKHEDDTDRAERIARGMALVRPLLNAITNRTAPMLVDADPIRERALLRARREHGRPERPPEKPRTHKRSDYADPGTDEIAALATRYLIDGYPPGDVSERFAISRGWCEHVARRIRKPVAA